MSTHYIINLTPRSEGDAFIFLLIAVLGFLYFVLDGKKPSFRTPALGMFIGMLLLVGCVWVYDLNYRDNEDKVAANALINASAAPTTLTK